MIKRGAEHAAAMRKIKNLKPGVFIEVTTLNGRYRGYVKRVAVNQLLLLNEQGGTSPLNFATIVKVANARSIVANARDGATAQRKGKS